MVVPFHGSADTGQYLTRADRVRLWLGVGATGLIALAAIAAGVGFEAGDSSSVGVVFIMIIGALIALSGVLAGVAAYRMSRLRARSAATAFKFLWLPGLTAFGATMGAFDDGFRLGTFIASVGLLAGVLVCALMISQAATVLQRFGR
jgi:hypothetical protein